jgi:hypothetical protein
VPTIADLMTRATTGLDRLVALGETVEDEWQYVTDLATAYRARFAAVAAARGGEVADEPIGRAIDLVVEEAGSIEDPHRAIDWLSTLPQIVLLAVGESA